MNGSHIFNGVAGLAAVVVVAVFVSAIDRGPGARGLGGCMRRPPLDTTKDFYDDDEVPEFQVQIFNGVRKEVPWDEVPEKERFMTYFEHGKTVSRVPRVEVRIFARNNDGSPVSRWQDADEYSVTEVALNPRHSASRYGGKNPRH